MRAYVLVTVKPGTSEDVVKEMKKTKGVVQADSVWGRYDLIAVVEAPNIESIGETVYKAIAKNPNIIHTETLLTL